MDTSSRDAALEGQSARIGLNSAALVGARFLGMALAFAQTAIVLRALGKEGFGEYSVALAFPALFVAFATLGIPRLLVRDIARSPEEGWRRTWTALAVIACLSLAVLALIALTMQVTEPSGRIRAATCLAALSIVVLWSLQRPFEALLTAHEHLLAVGVLHALGSVLRLAGAWFAVQVAVSSSAVLGAIAVANSTAVLLSAVVTVVLVGWERPRFDAVLARSQIVESLPLVLAMVLSLVYARSDVYILFRLQGEAAAGLYGSVQRIAEPIMSTASLWATAVFPALCRFSKHAPDDFMRLKRSSTRMAVLVSLPIAFGLAMVAEPIMGLLAGRRLLEMPEAVPLLRVVCVVIPFYYFNAIAQEFLYASHRQWYITLSVALAACISVGGNLLIIPHAPVYGVAVVAIAANLSATLLLGMALRQEMGALGLPWLLAKTMVACTAMAGVAYALADSLVLAVLAGILIYMLVQHRLGALDDHERRLARTLLGRMARLVSSD